MSVVVKPRNSGEFRKCWLTDVAESYLEKLQKKRNKTACIGGLILSLELGRAKLLVKWYDNYRVAAYARVFLIKEHSR